MSQLFELLIRILGFASTLYFLLEYILTCKIDTTLGLIITLAVSIGVLLIFKFYTCKYVAKCNSCESNIIHSKF
jgi:hypothetical protein